MFSPFHFFCQTDSSSRRHSLARDMRDFLFRLRDGTQQLHNPATGIIAAPGVASAGCVPARSEFCAPVPAPTRRFCPAELCYAACKQLVLPPRSGRRASLQMRKCSWLAAHGHIFRLITGSGNAALCLRPAERNNASPVASRNKPYSRNGAGADRTDIFFRYRRMVLFLPSKQTADDLPHPPENRPDHMRMVILHQTAGLRRSRFGIYCNGAPESCIGACISGGVVIVMERGDAPPAAAPSLMIRN